MIRSTLLVACLIAIGTHDSHATTSSPSLREACDAATAPSLGSRYDHWRCSGIVAASYADLERQVQANHDVAKGWTVDGAMTLYVSRPGPASAWLFQREQRVAIRWANEYAADGHWTGVAMSAFCAGTEEDCRRAQEFVLEVPPPPGIGPPVPEEPPVVFDKPSPSVARPVPAPPEEPPVVFDEPSPIDARSLPPSFPDTGFRFPQPFREHCEGRVPTTDRVVPRCTGLQAESLEALTQLITRDHVMPAHFPLPGSLYVRYDRGGPRPSTWIVGSGIAVHYEHAFDDQGRYAGIGVSVFCGGPTTCTLPMNIATRFLDSGAGKGEPGALPVWLGVD